MANIHKIGMLIVKDGCMLLCRKRGTTFLILPGGKIDPGESAEACLQRELREELGEVSATEVTFIGTYTDQAANEPSQTVQVDLYGGKLHGDPAPQSEIEELIWFDPSGDTALLSPSIRRQILPDLRKRNLL